MTRRNPIEKYFDAVAKASLYSSKGNLAFRLKILFKGICFENRSMIDIGGGSGLFSFYAACKGAKEIVCLEPRSEGSLAYAAEGFAKLASQLPDLVVRLEEETIQTFDAGAKKFDIILLHNSINHLDEAACIHLKEDENSRVIYTDILRKIISFGAAGSKLIISDCSRYNFFGLLGAKNPFAPHIEWHKHQSPMLWIQLLEEVGFRNPELNWICPDQLRSLGQVVFGNQLMSFFLGSYFFLRMEKGGEETTVLEGCTTATK